MRSKHCDYSASCDNVHNREGSELFCSVANIIAISSKPLISFVEFTQINQNNRNTLSLAHGVWTTGSQFTHLCNMKSYRSLNHSLHNNNDAIPTWTVSGSYVHSCYCCM